MRAPPQTLPLFVLLLWVGCGESASQPDNGLPALRDFDPERAEAGRVFLFDEWPGDGLLPTLAVLNLSLVWDEDVSDAEYWDEFERRYGFFKPEGADWPLGFHYVGGGQLSLSCLACHTDKGPGGEPIIGVGNRRLDFRRLIEDLQALADLAGQPSPPIPDNLQLSPGAIDAVGLGVQLAGGDASGGYGFQQAPAWWTQRYKDKNFTDGTGHVDNWRTMMATLMVFGWSQDTMEQYDPQFQDLQQYLVSLEAPAWPFDARDDSAVSRGEELFVQTCARCHGTYGGDEAFYPDKVVDLGDIQTDPVRATSFAGEEIDALNQSWFAEPAAFEDTEGYLAPPLLGVWASAPYFHNGSVPDLMAVLDSTARPALWKLTDPPSYDAERGGWAWESTTTDDRRAYDTSMTGLDNGGHSYGDHLTAAERADLVAYLTTL